MQYFFWCSGKARNERPGEHTPSFRSRDNRRQITIYRKRSKSWSHLYTSIHLINIWSELAMKAMTALSYPCTSVLTSFWRYWCFKARVSRIDYWGGGGEFSTHTLGKKYLEASFTQLWETLHPVVDKLQFSIISEAFTQAFVSVCRLRYPY